MKARLENGQIKRYLEIPKYFSRWAGNFHEQSNEVHEQHGFFDLVSPALDIDLEERDGELYFDGVNKIFTWAVKNKVLPTLADSKTIKIKELKTAVKELYNEIQSYFIEKQIHSETIPEAAKDKIKAIRTNYESIKTEINGLTTVVEVIKYQLPHAAIENLREQLENIE